MNLPENHENAVRQLYTLAKLNEKARELGSHPLNLITTALMLSTNFGMDSACNAELQGGFVTLEAQRRGIASSSAVVITVGKYKNGLDIGYLTTQAVSFLHRELKVEYVDLPYVTPIKWIDTGFEAERDIWLILTDMFFESWIEDAVILWLDEEEEWFENVVQTYATI